MHRIFVTLARPLALFCGIAAFSCLHGQATPAGLPIAFEPNVGQTDSRVRYIGRGSGATAFFSANEAVLRFHQAGTAEGESGVLRIRFAGALPQPRIEAQEPQAGKSNYFLGSQQAGWRRDVPRYGRIEYHELYPGVDAFFYGSQNRLEYDLVLRPGAKAESIRLRFEGERRVRLDANGDLVVKTASGEIRQKKPVFYQEYRGIRTPVEGRYVLRGPNEAGIEVARYERSAALVIDPVVYATYLGGNGNDYAYGMRVDAAGNVYLAGATGSPNFPVKNAEQSVYASNNDAFVAKMDSTGALIWCTFLGGSGTDQGATMAIDAAGAVYVTGRTGSTNFPVLNAYQAVRKGSTDAFVSKLDANGGLVYSTYLGGSSDEYGFGIAVDAAGNASISGYTASTDFPRLNAFQNVKGFGNDGFITKLNAAGTGLIFSSFIGGNGQDYANDVTATDQGDTYVVGDTTSTDFPMLTPLQSANAGGIDGFITHLNAQGAIVYSTYLGGAGADAVRHLALNAAGEAWIVGETTSTNFPTRQPQQAANAGGYDAFVAKLDSAGATLLYSSYLGGNGDDRTGDIATDSSGNVYLTGRTLSTNFPLVNAAQSVNRGAQDAFLTKLNAAGVITYSTFLGGTKFDEGNRVAADAAGNAYVAGDTLSSDFPVAQASQKTLGGASDAFIVKIGTCAFQLSPLSTSLPAAGGQGTIQIITTPECPWTAVSNAPWLSITSAASGIGSGSAAFTAAQNTTANTLTGAIHVGDQSAAVTVAGSAFSLSSIAPSSGSRGATVSTVLTGQNLVAGTTLAVSDPGITIANVVSVSATQMTADLIISAAATPGPVNITATNSIGTSNAVVFTVNFPAPSLTSVNPASANAGSSVAVTLTGANFAAGATVSASVVGMTVSGVVVVSATQINAIVTIPAATPPGAYSIGVTTSAGTSNTVPFTVNTPVLSGITISPSSVLGGSAASANSVSLNAPAPTGGAVVTLTSSDPSATVPASVTVPAGATVSPVFSITTAPVASATPVTISATYGSVTLTGSLTVNPLIVSSVAASAGTLLGGGSTTITVTLNAPAPTGGMAVPLTSSDPSALPVPASLTVAAGSLTASVALTANWVSVAETITVSATLGGVTKSASVNVNPTVVSSVMLSPASLNGGSATMLSVTLNGPAPSGGAAVALASSDATGFPVPAILTVPAGALTAGVSVTASAANAPEAVTVSASYGSATASSILTITSLSVSAISVAPASVASGKPATVTVTLSGAAPAGGIAVPLSSSDAVGFPVPASLLIAGGASSGSIAVTAGIVSAAESVTVSASYGGVKTATVSVTPIVVSAISLSPTTLVSGKAANITVTLSGAAPPGGAAVALTSSDTAGFPAPASLTVAAGATSGTLAVTAGWVSATEAVTVGAAVGGVSKSATLTLTPTTLSAISISPSSIVSGKTGTLSVTLNGPAGPGGVDVTLSSSDAVTLPAPATLNVPAGSTTGSATLTASWDSAATPVSVSGTVAGVTKTASATITPTIVSTLSLVSANLVGSKPTDATITLNGPAPPQGMVLNIASSDPVTASVPASVMVAGGAIHATFTVNTVAVAAYTEATITVSAAGSSASAVLSVNPPHVASLGLSPSTVRGGTGTVSNVVTLNGPAPAGGSVVMLSSSDPSATTPASVTVLAGATTAKFPISTNPVSATTVVTITAALGGPKMATITVTP